MKLLRQKYFSAIDYFEYLQKEFSRFSRAFETATNATNGKELLYGLKGMNDSTKNQYNNIQELMKTGKMTRGRAEAINKALAARKAKMLDLEKNSPKP